MTIREALISDIGQMQKVRNAVTENVLSDPDLITGKDYETYITAKGKGWVCEINNQLTGFAIADLKDNNIWALFVCPEFEGKGIGKRLHCTMLDWYFTQTKNNVWLSTSPDTRAEMFYRNLGWKVIGMHGTEVKFEMTFEDWMKREI